MILGLVLLLAFAAQSPDAGDLRRAQALLDAGRCGEAIPLLKRLVEAHPQAATLRYGLGRCYFDTNDFTAAASTLETVARDVPDTAEVKFYLGSALGLAGHYDEAISQLRRVVELDASFQPAYRALGMFRVQRGQFSKDALSALEKAVSLKPSDARAHYWLGRFYLGLGDYARARPPLERAGELEPADLQTQLALGQSLLGDGEFDAAIGRFNAVLAEAPTLVPAMLGKAKALYSLGQVEPALPLAEASAKGAQGFEDERSSVWLVARLNRLLGHEAAAKTAEERLQTLEATFAAEVLHIRELTEQAARLMAEGQAGKAVPLLEEALGIRETPNTLLKLGDAFLDLKRYADAQRCYRRASASGALTPELASRLDRLERLMNAQ